MKKIFMLALIALSVAGTAFAKTYVVDIADSVNGKSVPIKKDPYATDYKVIPPVDVTSYFAGVKFQPGDTIEIYYNFVSSQNINRLGIIAIDNSEVANYWTVIAGDYTQSIDNIKAGVPIKGIISLTVVQAPKQNITIQLMSNDKVEGTITLTKTSGVKTGSSK